MAQFNKGEQWAWFHDEGQASGFFHTYDCFQMGGADERPRKIHVFLPREYEHSGVCYPVVYMNDGDTAFFPGGLVGKSWWVAEVLTSLYDSNTICPLIVVAVCPLNRDREYTHAPLFPQWVIQQQNCCGLETYARYLSQSVKPFIDRHYRTLPEAITTTILGSSHGGLAAFYTACCHPTCFGNIGALSPSFWVGLDTGLGMFTPLERSKLLAMTAKTLRDPALKPRIWLDWGLSRDNGFHNWFIEHNATKRGREMSRLLEQKFGYIQGQNLFVYEDPQGEHTEESWSRRLPYILEAFYGSRECLEIKRS